MDTGIRLIIDKKRGSGHKPDPLDIYMVELSGIEPLTS